MSALSRTGQFIRRSLLGGLVVLLPITMMAFFFRWLYKMLTGSISPMTGFFANNFGLPMPVADGLVVLSLILFCFLVGHMVTTRFGGWLWQNLEHGLMARLPGYLTLRDIIGQLFGGSGRLSRGTEVARVWLYGKDVDVSVTALVTAWHEDGRMTVFVPTGPNPTSGFIYHVAADLVETWPEMGVDQMMKTVLACGSGSDRFFAQAERERASRDG